MTSGGGDRSKVQRCAGTQRDATKGISAVCTKYMRSNGVGIEEGSRSDSRIRSDRIRLTAAGLQHLLHCALLSLQCLHGNTTGLPAQKYASRWKSSECKCCAVTSHSIPSLVISCDLTWKCVPGVKSISPQRHCTFEGIKWSDQSMTIMSCALAPLFLHCSPYPSVACCCMISATTQATLVAALKQCAAAFNF